MYISTNFLETNGELSGYQQLESIWKNVRLIAPSAHAALKLFELGAGDALITYEQDARLAMQKGSPLEIVIPYQTIITTKIEEAIAKSSKPAKTGVKGIIILGK